jgi:hypothetical protein
MSLQYVKMAFTTDTSGAATVYGDARVGKLFSVTYLAGDVDTGAGITLTSEGDASFPLLVKASIGTANVTFYPVGLRHGNTDGAALTGTAGGDRGQLLVRGRLKLVVASGGSVKSGSIIVAVEQP